MSDHLGYAHGAIHGATSYFLTVLPELSRRVDLTVCFLREPHPVTAQLEEEGVQPIFLARARSDPRALFDLVRIIRRERFHIVHSAGMKGILFGRLAARLAGPDRPRSIIHLHDLSPLSRLVGIAQRALARYTDAALAVSSAVAVRADCDFAIPRERVRVLHNPLPIERFAMTSEAAAGSRRRIRAEFGIESRQPVIGVIGRLSYEKGHAQLIRALPMVLGSVPDAVLLVVGDGQLRGACEELVSRLGLLHTVRFAGHRSDIPDVLAAVDVAAIPSLSEGFPYAALEAMAAGRPVVAFAVGGLPEIVQHERSGLLVPAGDEAALAAGIVRVIRDAELAARLIAGGVDGVQHLSISAHVSQLVALYDEVARRAVLESMSRSRERMVESA